MTSILNSFQIYHDIINIYKSKCSCSFPCTKYGEEKEKTWLQQFPKRPRKIGVPHLGLILPYILEIRRVPYISWLILQSDKYSLIFLTSSKITINLIITFKFCSPPFRSNFDTASFVLIADWCCYFVSILLVLSIPVPLYFSID